MKRANIRVTRADAHILHACANADISTLQDILYIILSSTKIDDNSATEKLESSNIHINHADPDMTYNKSDHNNDKDSIDEEKDENHQKAEFSTIPNNVKTYKSNNIMDVRTENGHYSCLHVSAALGHCNVLLTLLKYPEFTDIINELDQFGLFPFFYNTINLNIYNRL